MGQRRCGLLSLYSFIAFGFWSLPREGHEIRSLPPFILDKLRDHAYRTPGPSHFDMDDAIEGVECR